MVYQRFCEDYNGRCVPPPEDVKSKIALENGVRVAVSEVAHGATVRWGGVTTLVAAGGGRSASPEDVVSKMAMVGGCWMVGVPINLSSWCPVDVNLVERESEKSCTLTS